MCVFVCERGSERECVCLYVKGGVSVCVCVCLCVKGGVSVCVCVERLTNTANDCIPCVITVSPGPAQFPCSKQISSQ